MQKRRVTIQEDPIEGHVTCAILLTSMRLRRDPFFLRPISFVVCLSVLLSSCGADRVEYLYFELVDGNVINSILDEPDVWFYSGEKVPQTVDVSWNTRVLRIRNLDKCCVPVIEILSPVPLSDLIVDTGAYSTDLFDLPSTSCVAIHLYSETHFELAWSYWPEPKPSCISVGDLVDLQFVPEDGSEPLRLTMVLKRSGYYWKSQL